MKQVKGIIHFMIISSLVVVLTLAPWGGQQVHAAYTYQFDDAETSTDFSGGGAKVFGQYMVWYKADKAGDRQIHFQDLQTGTQLQITDVPSAKESPQIGVNSEGQAIVVWTDKRNHDQLKPIWDVYAYNVETKAEQKLNSAQAQFVAPSIHGDYVVWHDLTSRDMYVYHLATGQETKIGQGRYPIVAKGKVLFKNANDGGLSVYDIHSKETKKVVELPYHEYVFAFTFNGETALWGKTNLDKMVTYSFAQISSDEITVQNVTTPKKIQAPNLNITIGEQFGAWLEVRNGVAQIIGADLKNKQTYQITNSSSHQKLFSFEDDRLIMRGEQGNLIYRSITAVPSVNQPSQPSPQDPALATEKKIGAAGGVVEIKNHAQLSIPEGAFAKESLVAIREQKEKQSSLTNMQLMSKTWEIRSELPFSKEVQLTLAYDASKVVPQQVQKLAIYAYDKEGQTWAYVGGVADTGSKMLTTSITQPGVYAVWLHSKTFGDIQKHWAQQEIETLASRWIVNGVSEQRFAPNQSVTRAEFIKMLAASLDLEPLEGKQGSFSDVSSSHWAFGWIEAGYEAGIVQGSSGKFKPNDTITREEMMTMLVRALELEESATAEKTLASFKDGDKVSSWAKPYVALAIEHGLIEGANGEIKPAQASTRAMAAVVMYRLLEKEKKL